MKDVERTQTSTNQSQPSRSSKRAWTDLVFDLYIRGSLAPLAARDVCQSIDRITDNPSQLERMKRSSPEELRSVLIASVDTETKITNQR